MEAIVRTLYGSALQTARSIGVPYSILNNTTLNQLLNIQPTAVIPAGTYPVSQYYCIGNGGHAVVSGTGSVPYLKIIPHEAQHAGLYNILPFVLRPITNDLTPLQRASYSLRKAETHNGASYWAYYLKRIDMSAVTVDLQTRVVQDGVTTATDFIPNATDLTPTPPDFSNVGTNNLTAKYLVASSTLPVSLTQAECQEFLDAATIIYGDDNYAIISEMGLCSGVDKIIVLEDNSNFKEVIGTQINSHIGRIQQVKFTATGILGTLEVGVNEPSIAVG
jgi:hypothetical protein